MYDRDFIKLNLSKRNHTSYISHHTYFTLTGIYIGNDRYCPEFFFCQQ